MIHTLHTLIFFAATSGSDSLSAEALQHIVQLVILCIPLITLPLILKTSSSILGRVNGMAEKFNSKTFEPGLKGSGGFMKNRALNTEARMANMSGSNSRLARGLGRAGSFRARRARKKSNIEEWRKYSQEKAVDDYLSGNIGGDNYDTDLAAKRQGRFAGPSDASKVALSVDKLKLRREIESMEPAKLKLEAHDLKIKSAALGYQEQAGFSAPGADKTAFLAQQFAQAQTNEQRAALSDLAMQQGSSGRQLVSDFASQLAGTEAGASLSSHLGKNYYEQLESATPEVTDFINSGGSNAPGTVGAGSFAKVTSETIGKLDVGSLERALQAGHIDQSILRDSMSDIHRGKITTEKQQIIQRYI